MSPLYESLSAKCSKRAIVTSVWGKPLSQKAVIWAEGEGEWLGEKEELGIVVKCVQRHMQSLYCSPCGVATVTCQLCIYHHLRPLPPLPSLPSYPFVIHHLLAPCADASVVKCDVFVDTINRIEITTTSRELVQDDMPQRLDVRGFDAKGRQLCISQALSCTIQT